MFKYHIEIKLPYIASGNYQRIASFDNEQDRDECMVLFSKKYTACKFIGVDMEDK
jgi:hypothetical protein